MAADGRIKQHRPTRLDLRGHQPDTLWSGNQDDAGPVARPILDVSRDGGRTWSDARLPGLIGDVFVNDTLVGPRSVDRLARRIRLQDGPIRPRRLRTLFMTGQ
jgi:hypothetical protein